MERTRQNFQHDSLLKSIRNALTIGLNRAKTKAPHGISQFSHADCLMSCLSVFTFKFPSLLQFDTAKNEDEHDIPL